MNTKLFAIVVSILIATSAMPAAYAISGPSRSGGPQAVEGIPEAVKINIQTQEQVEIPTPLPIVTTTNPLHVFILIPDEDQVVTGTVITKFLVLSQNNIREMKAEIKDLNSNDPAQLISINHNQSCRTFNATNITPIISVCKFEWDSKDFSGATSIKVIVTDINNNTAEDAVEVSVLPIVVKITEPVNSRRVTGIVSVRLTAFSMNGFEGITLEFEEEDSSKEQKFSILNNCSIMESMPSKAVCNFSWNSSSFRGEVKITAEAKDNQSNTAKDSVTVFVFPPLIPSEPPEPSTLSVKAFDAETGQALPNAVTVIIRRGIGVGLKQFELDEDEIEELEDLELLERHDKRGPSRSHTMFRAEIESRFSRHVGPGEVVVGVIKSDGIDSRELRPGVYRLVTFAEGYAPFEIDKLVVSAKKEYNLQAPLAEKSSQTTEAEKPKPEKPVRRLVIPITEITEKGKIIKIVTHIKEIVVEVIPTSKSKKVTINPLEIEGKFEIESDLIKAITDAEIEIEEGKLFIKTESSKKQIKVLPSTARDIAQEKGIKEFQQIRLHFKGHRPAYVLDASETGNLLAFIPVKIPVKAIIDAENGEIVTIEKPFWSFLVVRA